MLFLSTCLLPSERACEVCGGECACPSTSPVRRPASRDHPSVWRGLSPLRSILKTVLNVSKDCIKFSPRIKALLKSVPAQSSPYVGGSLYINRPQYGGGHFNQGGATFARSNSFSWHLHVKVLWWGCTSTQWYHTAPIPLEVPLLNPPLCLPSLNQTQSATTMTWTAWQMWPETLVCPCPGVAGPWLDLVKLTQREINPSNCTLPHQPQPIRRSAWIWY